MSVGDRGTPANAQNTNNHLGKVLRFNDDGTVPASNPLVGFPNTQPQIFCWGNRNIQGMAMHPATGEIYAHEHGPLGGDELNLIQPNTNYGWPVVTFGLNYNGTIISSDTTLPGMELPLTYWVPSIAPSGMTFIRNGQPDNEADILIGALAGTHIHWLKMKDNKRVSSTRSLNGYARFRDVRQAPDGKLYAMTESPNRFVLLRSNVPIVSVSDKNDLPFQVFPNPVSELLFIDLGDLKVDFGNLQIRIYDLTGRIMTDINPGLGLNNGFTLDVSNFPTGIYLLQLNDLSSVKQGIVKVAVMK